MLRIRMSTVALLALFLALPGLVAAQGSRQLARASSLCVRGMQHLQAGRIEQARAAFDKAEETVPGFADAADGLARVELQQKDYRKALEGFITAAKRYEIAAGQAAEQRLEKADELQQVQTAYRDYGVKAGPGCSDRLAGQGGPDPDTLVKPSDDPLPAGLRFRIGVCLLHLGRLGQARAAFRAELEKHPETSAAHVNLAVCELELGNAPQALTEIEAARKLGASVPDGLEHDVRVALAAKAK